MTKTLFTLLALLCLYTSVHAQLTKETITGTWICKESVAPFADEGNAEVKARQQQVTTGFLNAAFSFGVNGIFNIRFAPGYPAIMNELKFLDNQKWLFDAAKSKVSIGQNLMQIKVEQDSDTVRFALLETPFILRMEKQ